MFRAIQFKTAKFIRRITDADRVATLSKFMFLRDLLDRLQITEVLDVGGNAGQFATSLRYLGFQGSIVSFEPVPEVFTQLCKSMEDDPKWLGHNIALGEAKTTLKLNVMQSSVFSSFHAPIDDQGGLNTIVKTCSVPVLRLDEVLRGRDLSRTLLKVDTQGHEMQVFNGLGDMIRSLRAIVCEVSVNAIYEDTPRMTEVIQFLDEKGFKPACFAPVGRTEDLSAREFDYICVRA
jgi:FkbM family methyltransferase